MTDSLQLMAQPDALTIFFIRHGQAGGNGTIDGLQGAALSKTGERQADRLAKRLADFPLDHIYTSDMARTYQTADRVRRFHRHIPFDVHPEMREISPFQVRGHRPAKTARARAIRREERERVTQFAFHLRKRHRPGQQIAVIGHNGVNGMLMAVLSDTDYRRSVRFVCCHTSVSVFCMVKDTPPVALRIMGCVRHLPATLLTYNNVSS